MSILMGIAALVGMVLLLSGTAFGGRKAQLGIGGAAIYVGVVIVFGLANEWSDGLIWPLLGFGAFIALFLFGHRNSK